MIRLKSISQIFFVLGGAGAVLALALLIGPTGGYPSRPAFQTVTVRQANPNLALRETDAAADNALWDYDVQAERLTGRALTDAAAAVDWLRVDRTGNTIDSVDLRATAVTVNGAAIGGSGFITAQTAYNGAALTVGQTVIISRSADRTLSLTATCADDPDLQITNAPAGHYSVELHGVTTGGIEGVRLCAPTGGQLLGVTQCGGNASAGTRATDAGGAPCGVSLLYNFSMSGGTLKTFAGGTIAIKWRVNTSTNDATPVAESDTWFRVKRLT